MSDVFGHRNEKKEEIKWNPGIWAWDVTGALTDIWPYVSW